MLPPSLPSALSRPPRQVSEKRAELLLPPGSLSAQSRLPNRCWRSELSCRGHLARSPHGNVSPKRHRELTALPATSPSPNV